MWSLNLNVFVRNTKQPSIFCVDIYISVRLSFFLLFSFFHRFTGETGTVLKVIKNPNGSSRAMVLTDMSSKELEVCVCVEGFFPGIIFVFRVYCVMFVFCVCVCVRYLCFVFCVGSCVGTCVVHLCFVHCVMSVFVLGTCVFVFCVFLCWCLCCVFVLCICVSSLFVMHPLAWLFSHALV